MDSSPRNSSSRLSVNFSVKRHVTRPGERPSPPRRRQRKMHRQRRFRRRRSWHFHRRWHCSWVAPVSLFFDLVEVEGEELQNKNLKLKIRVSSRFGLWKSQLDSWSVFYVFFPNKNTLVFCRFVVPKDLRHDLMQGFSDPEFQSKRKACGGGAWQIFRCFSERWCLYSTLFSCFINFSCERFWFQHQDSGCICICIYIYILQG